MVGSEKNHVKRVSVGYIGMVKGIAKIAKLSSAYRVKERKIIMGVHQGRGSRNIVGRKNHGRIRNVFLI